MANESTDTAVTSVNVPTEGQNWLMENEFREREVRVKEREQETNEKDLEFRKVERALSRWTNPLTVAILAAAIAAAGNAWVAYLNGKSTRELEAQKAEQARILEIIKTGNPDKAAENLKFLLDAGLITEGPTYNALKAYLQKPRKAGSGPSLPVAARAPAEDVPQFFKMYVPEVTMEGLTPKVVHREVLITNPVWEASKLAEKAEAEAAKAKPQAGAPQDKTDKQQSGENQLK